MKSSPFNPNTLFKNIPIPLKSSTLKITKLINTKQIVYRCEKNPFFKCFSKNTFSITKNTKKKEQYTVLIYRFNDEILLEKRQASGLLAGLYGLPMIAGYKAKEELYRELIDIALEDIEYLGEFEHVFSHKSWKMNVFMLKCKYKIDKKGYWVKLNELEGRYAIPSAFSNILCSIIGK